MSDIVDRLRFHGKHDGHMSDTSMLGALACQEAVDEIERLRAELNEAATALPQAVRNERRRAERVIEAARAMFPINGSEPIGWEMTFLAWIYYRLLRGHGESPNVDYMQTLEERTKRLFNEVQAYNKGSND